MRLEIKRMHSGTESLSDVVWTEALVYCGGSGLCGIGRALPTMTSSNSRNYIVILSREESLSLKTLWLFRGILRYARNDNRIYVSYSTVTDFARFLG